MRAWEGVVTAAGGLYRLRAGSDEWVERLRGAGVSAHVASTVDEAMEDEAARLRGLSTVRELPDGRRIRTVGPAGRLSMTPAIPGFLVKPPGGDGQEVLDRVGLGTEFAELVERRAVARELPSGIELIGRFRST
jgi:crotonobetainyl-CoA:carnitine CoA-transferase CaiB-like acyl-CoA transferase